MIGRTLVVLVATMAMRGGAFGGAAEAGVERLYVLDCGTNVGKDQSRWSPGVNEGKSIECADNVLEERTAQRWINHDKAQSDGLRYAPAHHE